MSQSGGYCSRGFAYDPRLDWQEVCPNKPVKVHFNQNKQQQLIATELDRQQAIEAEVWEEIYLIGNPPYQGGKKKTKDQSEDFKHFFKHESYSKNLDYISIWFIKGAKYIKESSAKLAFVSTNSIVQGDHVGLLWPKLEVQGVEIGFCYTSFKWTNSAKDNAGVSCIVLGLRNPTKKEKYIFNVNTRMTASNINPYLVDADNIWVNSRQKALSDLPEMIYGNMPLEGGYLKLNVQEHAEILDVNRNSSKFIRPLIGGDNLLKGSKRYCLWIDDKDLELALTNPVIRKRVAGVKEFRMNGGDVARTLVNRPHQFRYRNVQKKSAIAIPCTSTERREYLVVNMYGQDVILDNSVQAIYDSETWVIAILSSKVHMTWTKVVAGRLKTDLRYSSAIVYNNFPVPNLTDEQKNALSNSARTILLTRENHTEKTLAEMYDPDKMPDDLREAHHQNDLLLDSLYRKKLYINNEERLADLFKLYEEMIAKQKN